MNKTRLEAFSDGVLAIIITIMVLELKVPHSSAWSELKPLLPVAVCYLLSFIFIGIYWGNHHHLMHTVRSVSSGMIWANMNLLFWLSLIPFATAWMGENHFESNTMAVYGAILLASGVAYNMLQKVVEKHTHDLEGMKMAMRNQKKKGILSAIGYSLSIPLAYVNPLIPGIIFAVVAGMWLIPDKNIEKVFKEEEH